MSNILRRPTENQNQKAINESLSRGSTTSKLARKMWSREEPRITGTTKCLDLEIQDHKEVKKV
jgi:hypothetical protein